MHLECDNFVAELLQENFDGSFSIKRSVPPGVLRFFYSNLSGHFYSKEFPNEKCCCPINTTLGDQKETVENVNVSYAEGIICSHKNPFDTQIRIPGTTYVIIKTEPEVEEIEYERIVWDISTSSFKDYRFDTEQRLHAGFELDFGHSRIAQFVKDPLDAMHVKEILENIYSHFKETYRHLAALGGNDHLCIGPNITIDFLNQCHAFDDLFEMGDFGVCWNSTKANRGKNEAHLGNRLSRHEFMEMITRIAIDKFVRNKICKNAAEALDKFISETLCPLIMQYDTNK